MYIVNDKTLDLLTLRYNIYSGETIYPGEIIYPGSITVPEAASFYPRHHLTMPLCLNVHLGCTLLTLTNIKKIQKCLNCFR